MFLGAQGTGTGVTSSCRSTAGLIMPVVAFWGGLKMCILAGGIYSFSVAQNAMFGGPS